MKYGFKNDGTKIEPGEGWYILPEGTVIEQGDEYMRGQKIWVASSDIGAALTNEGSCAYRRRITYPMWVKCWDRLPNHNRVCHVIVDGKMHESFYDVTLKNWVSCDKQITHWLDIGPLPEIPILPPVVEKVLTQEEVDRRTYEQWLDTNNGDNTTWSAFYAALYWERTRKPHLTDDQLSAEFTRWMQANYYKSNEVSFAAFKYAYNLGVGGGK